MEMRCHLGCTNTEQLWDEAVLGDEGRDVAAHARGPWPGVHDAHVVDDLVAVGQPRQEGLVKTNINVDPAAH